MFRAGPQQPSPAPTANQQKPDVHSITYSTQDTPGNCHQGSKRVLILTLCPPAMTQSPPGCRQGSSSEGTGWNPTPVQELHTRARMVCPETSQCVSPLGAFLS